MKSKPVIAVLRAAALSPGVAASLAQAQSWPAKPVKDSGAKIDN